GARRHVEVGLSGPDRKEALLLGAFIAEGFVSGRRAGFNSVDFDYFAAVADAYDSVVGGRRYISRRVIASGSTLWELDVHNMTRLSATPLAAFQSQRAA